MNEAELLLTDILGCDRTYLYLNKDRLLNRDASIFLSSVLKRRISGEPLEYILGKSDFMSLEFKVNPCVLIPRPETEILVETVLKHIRLFTRRFLRILDIGTGSGCIAVSLVKLRDGLIIDAVDVSQEALKIARENARLHQVNVNFIRGDLFTRKIKPKAYDVIVSNPPYIARHDFRYLPREVTREPKIALAAGKDGLDFYRKIIAQARPYLKGKGLLIMEIGFGQKEKILDIFKKENKFSVTETVKDLNNIDRVIVARLKRWIN